MLAYGIVLSCRAGNAAPARWWCWVTFGEQSRVISTERRSFGQTNFGGQRQVFQSFVGHKTGVQASDRVQESLQDATQANYDLSKARQRPAPAVLLGVVHDDFDAEHAFAFGIDLQGHFAVMHLEHRQIVRRCLDHDSPSGGILLSRVIMRAVLVAEDGLDPIQVQWRACPVNQRLENLIHLPAGTEPQIPAVLHLKHRVLILKPALFLLCQVQRKIQTGTVNPTLTELAQAPCSLFFRQGVCDLRQACCVADRSEAILLFGKLDPGFLRLRRHIFVTI
jgi:hypothetical protein